MGFLDFLTGVKRPAAGVSPVSKDALVAKIKALSTDKTPFVVGPSDESDLLVQLNIVDAKWYEIFAKAGLTKTYRIFLLLDDAAHEVRALEEMGELSWKEGVPSVSFSAEFFRGRTLGQKEFGTAYAFKDKSPGSFGKVYEYRFDVNDVKGPLIEVVTSSGWSYVPVTSKGKVKRKLSSTHRRAPASSLPSGPRQIEDFVV